jgi:hypothetical protein
VDEQYDVTARLRAAGVIVNVTKAPLTRSVSHISKTTGQLQTYGCACEQPGHVHQHKEQHANRFEDVVMQRHGTQLPLAGAKRLTALMVRV